MSDIIERPGELADKYYKKYDAATQKVFKITNPERIAARQKLIEDAKPGAKIKKYNIEKSKLFQPHVPLVELKLNPFTMGTKVDQCNHDMRIPMFFKQTEDLQKRYGQVATGFLTDPKFLYQFYKQGCQAEAEKREDQMTVTFQGRKRVAHIHELNEQRMSFDKYRYFGLKKQARIEKRRQTVEYNAKFNMANEDYNPSDKKQELSTKKEKWEGSFSVSKMPKQKSLTTVKIKQFKQSKQTKKQPIEEEKQELTYNNSSGQLLVTHMMPQDLSIQKRNSSFQDTEQSTKADYRSLGRRHHSIAHTPTRNDLSTTLNSYIDKTASRSNSIAQLLQIKSPVKLSPPMTRNMSVQDMPQKQKVDVKSILEEARGAFKGLQLNLQHKYRSIGVDKLPQIKLPSGFGTQTNKIQNRKHVLSKTGSQDVIKTYREKTGNEYGYANLVTPMKPQFDSTTISLSQLGNKIPRVAVKHRSEL